MNYVKLILLFFIFIPALTNAQDKTVRNPLTLSIVEEPVNLKKNRIRGYLGYQFETFNNYFSASGDKSKIIDYNMTSSMNQLQYFIEYGLTDCLQIGIYNAYQNGYEGYPTEWRRYYDHILNKTSIKEINGFEDILFNIGYDFVTKNKKLEFAFYPGIYLPMSNKPNQPEHIIINCLPDSILGYKIPLTNIDEITNEKVGTGSFRFELATKARFRFNKNLAVQTQVAYNFPFTKAKSLQWETIYDGLYYTYISNEVTYTPAKQFYYNIEFLIVPDKKEIMGLKFGIESMTMFKAWREVNNNVINIPNSRITSTYVNLELIVTENIRFTQQLSYDIAGRNIKSAFGSKTSFTFNFMKNE